MFNKISRFLERKVPLKTAALIIVLCVFAFGTVAWVGSAHEDRLVNTLLFRAIEPAHYGGTGEYWATLGGDPDNPNTTGVSTTGTWRASGSTIYGIRLGSTVLSATTGVGYTISGPDQGNIFYLGSASAIVNGGGQTNDSTVGGGSTANLAKSGITVNFPNPITASMNDWEFTIVNHRSGTSEVVPLAASTGAGDISGVTFIGMSDPGSQASGVTPGSAISGATINSYGELMTFIARYQPTADPSGNTNHYIIKDYKLATN